MIVFEPLGFVKYREFLDHLNNYKFLKKNCGLFSLSAIWLIFQFIVPENNTDWSFTEYTGLVLQKYKRTLIHPLTPFLGGHKIAKCDLTLSYLSICLSVCSHATTLLPLDGFS